MKKRFAILFLTALAVFLLSITTFAAPTMLKSVDVVFELPKGGDPFDPSFQPTILSFKSGDIDLLSTGAGILYASWTGDIDYNEDGVPCFSPGVTYSLIVKLALNIEAGYCANYKMSNGDYLVGPDTFSATVNGIPATVTPNNPPYFPTLEVGLTLAGEAIDDAEKAEMEAEQKALAETRRAAFPARTRAEADLLNIDTMPRKVVTVNTSGTDLRYDFENVTTLVMDVNDAEALTDEIVFMPYLTEVWLSHETDLYKFVQRMDSSLKDPVFGKYYFDTGVSHMPFFTAKATVFVPESKANALREQLANVGYPLVYTVKTYAGEDVCAAQKAGSAAAKDFCTAHSFTAQIRSADRVCTFASCQSCPLFYYSCAICGKCEYDPNHVDFSHTLLPEELTLAKSSIGSHSDANLYAELPNDSAYVGINAAGQHVYWDSCILCGKSSRYLNQHLSESDYIFSGTEASFEDYQAAMNAGVRRAETVALGSTEVQPGMFVLAERSDAKMSAWAQSDVNLALNDGLLDTDILGNDYTKNITRLQFCSIVVNLAEMMTGKTITPAANIFTDTDSLYVRKAFAAGITAGTSADTFSPNATLNRQQMATFVYRTLRYIEKNSDYAYTDYNSKLDAYTDSTQLEVWAKESMAFMNALDLIKGNTETTLNPNGICTVEQAIAVAERSVYAHQIGWYQVEPYKDVFNMGTGEWSATNKYTSISTGFTLYKGEYVWVTGRRFGNYNDFSEFAYNVPHTYAPVVNPFTGQTNVSYIKNGDLVPVRN